MKKRKKELLSSILALPLLMSNSPMILPSYETNYQDVAVSCTHEGTYELADNYTKEKYLLTIENQGDLYPRMFKNIKLNNEEIPYTYTLGDNLFTQEVVPLGETKTYAIITNEKLPLNDGTNRWGFEAMNTLDEDVSISDYSIYEGNKKSYTIEGEIDGLKGTLEYSAIVDVTYKGVRYAFETDVYRSGRLGTIYATKELDLSELTIDSIKFYKSRNERVNILEGIGNAFSALIYTALGIAVTIVVVVVLVNWPFHKAKKNKEKKKEREKYRLLKYLYN